MTITDRLFIQQNCADVGLCGWIKFDRHGRITEAGETPMMIGG